MNLHKKVHPSTNYYQLPMCFLLNASETTALPHTRTHQPKSISPACGLHNPWVSGSTLPQRYLRKGSPVPSHSAPPKRSAVGSHVTTWRRQTHDGRK